MRAPLGWRNEAPGMSLLFISDLHLDGERPDITVLSVAPLLAKAIRNVHDHASVSSLFTT